MSDLISRQAAIDAVMKVIREGYKWQSSVSEKISLLNAVYCALEDIPSAQPTVDAVPVVRCKDCKYYEEQDETIGTCLLTESGAYVKGYCSWAEVKDE